MYSNTFSPIKIGPLKLKNRLVMAPLTRQVAELDGTPTDEMAAYYARRARGGVGLIISEGTYEIDELGCKAYLSQPGIANSKHIEGWKKTTQAVHAFGTPIICQLMHGGRVSDPRCLFSGESAVSASATQSEGWVLYTDNDEEFRDRGIQGGWPQVMFPPARALTAAELEQVADGFALGAARAIEAGFDGVEVHGANGYLVHQFINPKTNLRKDEYGGSAENNVRFAKLICQKVRDAIGPDKLITLRLSQDGVDDFSGAWPGGVEYAHAIGLALSDCAADALHWSSFDWTDNRDPNSDVPMAKVIKEASGKMMLVNGGIIDGLGTEAVFDTGAGDAAVVGRPLFAQPDWPHIIRSGIDYPWAEFDRKYVIQPPVDLGLCYPMDRYVTNWNPDTSKRR
jgi:2,4-dienoyl-CoA reductase-like NADH-dependent reductase (Old Yellow Enzyme family)